MLDAGRVGWDSGTEACRSACPILLVLLTSSTIGTGTSTTSSSCSEEHRKAHDEWELGGIIQLACEGSSWADSRTTWKLCSTAAMMGVVVHPGTGTKYSTI